MLNAALPAGLGSRESCVDPLLACLTRAADRALKLGRLRPGPRVTLASPGTRPDQIRILLEFTFDLDAWPI